MAIQKDYLNGEKINTVYLGGGTPSLFTGTQLMKIIEALYTHFHIDPVAEWTLEANPDDLDHAFIKQLKTTPVNRFSVGIQSFFEEDLKYLNRVHTAKQARTVVNMIRENGFENFNVDLIYGIPTLSNDHWRANLDLIAQWQLPHLSAYALTVEPKTPLEVMIRKGKKTGVDEEKIIEQMNQLMEWADKTAYDHYEISNLALPGFRSKHNSAYWQGASYLGLGPAAHSYNGVSRQWNTAGIQVYLNSLKEKKIPYEVEFLSKVQQFNEYLITRIRTKEGIWIEEVRKNFEKSYLESIQPVLSSYRNSGYLVEEDGFIRLSRKGIGISDAITADLMLDDEQH